MYLSGVSGAVGLFLAVPSCDDFVRFLPRMAEAVYADVTSCAQWEQNGQKVPVANKKRKKCAISARNGNNPAFYPVANIR